MNKPLVLLRRASQIFFFFLFVYILWSTTYPLSGKLSAETFFKIDPLIMILTSISERLFLSGIVFSLIMILFTVILGRFFCGWVCPLGAFLDFISSFKKTKVLTDIRNKSSRRTKFFFLGAIFIAAVFGFQIAWILDPLVITARFVSLNMIPTVTLSFDMLFAWLIRSFGLYGGFYDFYRQLKMSILGVKISYFAHSLIIFLFFSAIAAWGLYIKRSWCRITCPLGALYALFSRFSLLERKIQGCTKCMKCKSSCRMGAIKDDASYEKPECILCMDCVYDCPVRITSFGFGSKTTSAGKVAEKGITRRQFLFLGLLSGLSIYGFKEEGKEVIKQVFPGRVIRPPASLVEEEFKDRCIRCGNCMKVCITNGLQPVLLETGLSGIWTPQLIPEIGYCEYQCTLCGNVCPTGAIPKLSVADKKNTRLGIAKIDRGLCLPWKKKKQCIVCEEHCPVAKKAIRFKKVVLEGKMLYIPYVDQKLCIGCGICQTKCPVRPERAIKVYPVSQTRTKPG